MSKVQTVIDESRGTITVTVPIDKTTPMSKKKRSRILATTNGFVQTELEFKDKPVSVSVNVIVPK